MQQRRWPPKSPLQKTEAGDRAARATPLQVPASRRPRDDRSPTAPVRRRPAAASSLSPLCRGLEPHPPRRSGRSRRRRRRSNHASRRPHASRRALWGRLSLLRLHDPGRRSRASRPAGTTSAMKSLPPPQPAPAPVTPSRFFRRTPAAARTSPTPTMTMAACGARPAPPSMSPLAFLSATASDSGGGATAARSAPTNAAKARIHGKELRMHPHRATQTMPRV